MKDYYYEAKVRPILITSANPIPLLDSSPFQTTTDVQGCDGKKAKPSQYRGIMYKEKRYGRKMIKTIAVIKKRVKLILKNKNQNS